MGIILIVCFVIVIGMAALGVMTLALQNHKQVCGIQNKNKLSLLFNVTGVVLFIVSQQPYAAVFTFGFLIIKAMMLMR